VANSEHVAILKRGAKAWNRWRSRNPGVKPALSRAKLSWSDLRWTRLEQADLRGANLRRACLKGADLTGANISKAHLAFADLSSAFLSGADMRGAYLCWAKLDDTSLSKANLTKAVLGETILGNLDLSDTIGLNSCDHRAPSIIDYRTLAQSRNLPLPFLRGCGLPDQLIEYLPSLLNQPIQFFSCFISYSTKDQEFAERLYADLQNKGVRCWFAPHDAQGGKKLHEQIDRAIQIHDRLLLILSEHSMNSEWVRTEIAKARKRERNDNRRMLFPVRLVDFQTLRDWECFDADAGKDSAREIREYYIPDFSNWKDHDEYQREFEKLLRDLKNELSPP